MGARGRVAVDAHRLHSSHGILECTALRSVGLRTKTHYLWDAALTYLTRVDRRGGTAEDEEIFNRHVAELL